MILSGNKLSKSFNGTDVLDDVSVSVSGAATVCLLGTSGNGKTTLMNIMAGMLEPDHGYVTIDQKPVSDWNEYRSRVVGYLPCGNSLIESLTVRENLSFAVRGDKKKTDQIDNILTALGILSTAEKYPRQLSSGEYKRACFARVIALDTPFLFLDEPTSNLDSESADAIFQIIRKLNGRKGILIATHDSRFVTDDIMRPKQIRIKNGKLFS